MGIVLLARWHVSTANVKLNCISWTPPRRRRLPSRLRFSEPQLTNHQNPNPSFSRIADMLRFGFYFFALYILFFLKYKIQTILHFHYFLSFFLPSFLFLLLLSLFSLQQLLLELLLFLQLFLPLLLQFL